MSKSCRRWKESLLKTVYTQMHAHTQTAKAPIERHYACWQYDRLAQRDPQTSRPHNETGQEHWGSWGRDELVVGGAIGICQSTCCPQRMSWTLLSLSVCEGWQLQTEDNVHSSAATYLSARMNYHKAEKKAENTAKPCSTVEEQTLIKPVCTWSVCWWSVSSSWQITTCIRFKRRAEKEILVCMSSRYLCNSTHSKNAVTALYRPHWSLLLCRTTRAGGPFLGAVYTDVWPSSVLSSITRGYTLFKLMGCWNCS